MKNVKINVKNLVKVFFTFIFSLFTCLGINAQTKSWTTTNPFQTDVFVQNFGQFDNWAKNNEPIKYAVNNSSKVFFTAHGLVYKLTKIEKLSEEEIEEMEGKEDKEARPKVETYYVNMTWEGCNPNATIEVSEQTQGYYTFGEKGYENIKAKGYRKLTYKNLYNNIDVEYIIPAKGGIKYSIILHEGADISKVKMLYSGDVEKINKDNEGNIILSTPAGNITDHAPKSFYESTKENIVSSFDLKQNIVSFKLSTFNFQLSTVVIDPWTTTPDSLTTNNCAYDVASDNYGNVYVSGGSLPHKLSKYSNTGNLLWTFTNPSTWSYNGKGYSKFCLLHYSGTIFIGEGFSAIGFGPRIMKINNNGTLINTSIPFVGNQELWLIFYNRCTEQLMGFGGGADSSNNLQQLADTNLTSSTVNNTNGFTGRANDIGAAVMDNNGDFYSLIISSYNPNNNYIQKNLFLNAYNLPLSFNINTGYNFKELFNDNIIGLNSISLYSVTVRTNALALNNNYLCSYDGHILKAWDKITGTLLNSIIVNTSYCIDYLGQSTITSGHWRKYEGIAIDNCNNIWVGGNDTVFTYTFNGTNFIVGIPITQNIKGEVYDINYNSSLNLLSICGDSFLTVQNVPFCQTVSCETNINDTKINSNSEVSIFPNPSSNSFTIIIPSKTNYVEISNSLGQIMEKRIINNENKLNFTINERGLFFVKVVTERDVIIKKVIINN